MYVGGLPLGTPVQLLLTAELNSMTQYVGWDSGSASISAASTLGTSALTLQNSNGPHTSPTNGTQTESVIVDTYSGQQLALGLTFNGQVNDQAAAFGAAFSALADASDTANDYIDVLTPGAKYTTASGINYESPPKAPAPEPTVLWLIPGELAGLALFVRHRRGRQGWAGLTSRWMSAPQR